MVAAWIPSLGQTGLTLFDVGPFDNNGTLIDGPTWGVGEKGVHVNFDGDNDYAEITSGIAALDTAHFSVSMSVRVTAVETSNTITLVGFASRGNTDIKRSLGLSAGDLVFDNFPPTLGALSIPEPSRNEWHNIVATDVDGVARQLFVDGKLENSDGGESYSSEPLDAIDIMSWVDLNRNIAGQLSDLAMWSRILTPGEIQERNEDPDAMFRLWVKPHPTAVVAAAGFRKQYILGGGIVA